MKLLISSLCLGGNKGGPAIAISLMKQIQIADPSIHCIFVVPPGKRSPRESELAKKYGLEVVSDLSVGELLTCVFSKHPVLIFERIKKWWNTIRQCDFMMDMSGISYTGPPMDREWNTINSSRVRYFFYSRFFHKRFIGWTQSIGPLSTGMIRRLAKRDFSSQPFIFCRGENSLKEVRDLLPSKKAYSFPDIAFALPAESRFGHDYVRMRFGEPHSKRLVTVSPSAVIYGKVQTTHAQNRHVETLADFCKCLLDLNEYRVLLVPHTFVSEVASPTVCDYAVSREILRHIGTASRDLQIVKEDFSPTELKSIIGQAYIHVGARYHSLVAALASGVPSISLAWHPKYHDLMKLFGLKEYNYDIDGPDLRLETQKSSKKKKREFPKKNPQTTKTLWCLQRMKEPIAMRHRRVSVFDGFHHNLNRMRIFLTMFMNSNNLSSEG